MNIKEVLDIGRSSEIETLPPTYYFYAAYIFDQVETQKEDIRFLLEESQHLGKTVRYWWLSQAMDIQSSPDRLIV
ncbi:MAG: hypothetical protein NTZ74_06880 [Chloroflexi bacterium]|nr:hypothetical protein [Chloroflexota bacterium]